MLYLPVDIKQNSLDIWLNGSRLHFGYKQWPKSSHQIKFQVSFLSNFYWNISKKKHISMCCYPLKSQTLHSFCSIHYKYHIFYQVVQNPRHLGTDLDISVLGTGHFRTIFETDHNCLVLINCQYFCTSSSLIYDPKVDRYEFLIIPGDRCFCILIFIYIFIIFTSIYYLQK